MSRLFQAQGVLSSKEGFPHTRSGSEKEALKSGWLPLPQERFRHDVFHKYMSSKLACVTKQVLFFEYLRHPSDIIQILSTVVSVLECPFLQLPDLFITENPSSSKLLGTLLWEPPSISSKIPVYSVGEHTHTNVCCQFNFKKYALPHPKRSSFGSNSSTVSLRVKADTINCWAG